MSWIGRVLAIVLIVALEVVPGWAEVLPRAVLILDQSGPGMFNPGYFEISHNLRSVLRDKSTSPVAVYLENTDFVRFNGPQYNETVRRFLEDKYHDVPIGAIIAVGSAALQFALQLRSDHWREVPIVFAGADVESVNRLKSAIEERDVTGRFIRISLANSVGAARTLVPDLSTIALVGDPLETQPLRKHFREEMPSAAVGLQTIDLTGLPIDEVGKRVTALPDASAILYTAITKDGAGRDFVPYEACEAIARSANRPIIIDVDNRIGHGGTGGVVVKPALIGREAAEITLRVLDGERAADIPIAASNSMAMVFDWRQLRRWGIDEAQLPKGSEIVFRQMSFWEEYRWRIVLFVAAFFLQSALIVALWIEDRRRRFAEATGQMLMSELTHSNRVATAGQLAASIAHDVRQPLAAITASASAGLNWLKSRTPDIEEVRLLLKTIVTEGHRADDIITNIRSTLRKETTPQAPININDILKQVIPLAGRKMDAAGIVLRAIFAEHPSPIVFADPVQLQQVTLNLMMNAIEAMNSSTQLLRELGLKTHVDQDAVVLVVEDTGPGISPADMEKIFTPFFTTKAAGMGMGLAICKSIVEAHGGRLSVRGADYGGARFEMTLPYYRGRQ